MVELSDDSQEKAPINENDYLENFDDVKITNKDLAKSTRASILKWKETLTKHEPSEEKPFADAKSSHGGSDRSEDGSTSSRERYRQEKRLG